MKRKNKNKFIYSMFVVLFSAVMFGVALNSSSKLVNASTDKLDDIQHQIITLKDLNYNPKQVKRIIKMTNKDADFYIQDYNDKVVIAKSESSGNLKEITVIDFKN